MQRGPGGILLAAVALWIACGQEAPPPAPVMERGDFESSLAVAGMMREIGLPDVALSECRFVLDNAEPGEPLRVEAYFLSGDCELDKGNLERAIAQYMEVGDRYSGEKPRASRKIAEAYLNRGRWTDALEVLEKVDLASIPAMERSAFEDLIAKILPITRLHWVLLSDIGGRADEAKRGNAAFQNWIVRSPLHFTQFGKADEEHARIQIHFQKEMRGLFHPLPWQGSSFRLTLRFRIDGVDRREHQIAGSFGIQLRRSFLETPQRTRKEEDRFFIRITAMTHVEGEHRSRKVGFWRQRAAEDGLDRSNLGSLLMTDAMLDTWYRGVVEYSRELASLRLRIFQTSSYAEDKIVVDQVFHKVPPFGEGPFFLFFGGNTEGGDRYHTMDVSVDYLCFEIPEKGVDPPEGAVGVANARHRGNRHFFFRDWKGAVEAWESMPGEGGSPWLSRFLRWKACVRAGYAEKARALEGHILKNAGAFKPSEVDAVEWAANFDGDAARFYLRLKEVLGRKD
ncbi:MAG: tetratricopeptide repeat protein [Planctomycetota bacterium]|jgi:hypothetical protein